MPPAHTATYYARLSGSCINAQISILTPKKLHLSRCSCPRVCVCVRACDEITCASQSARAHMIYGDQSQEGFLLRDYFCCDTNEPRLQPHCRPITTGEEAARLLRSNNQTVFVVFTPCPNVHLHVHPRGVGGEKVAHMENVDRRAIVCLPCRRLSALLIYRCCIVLPGSFTRLHLSLHQYATYACVRLGPRREGFVTGGGGGGVGGGGTRRRGKGR